MIDFRPLVCVSSITYNHAPYIEDAMNGFCMQQTTFPFVCTILDDASTDGEPEIIKSYLQKHFDLDDNIVRNEETKDYVLTFARHKTNKNCYFAVYYLKYNHYSTGNNSRKDEYIKEWLEKVKYIALCEGDDYWTDSYKLQKQVDVLDDNDNVLLVYSAFETVDDTGKKMNRPYFDFIQRHSKSGDFLYYQIIRNHIMTLTTCCRKELLNTSLYKNCPFHFDYSLSMCASMLGDLHYIPEKTGCYRKTSGSLIVLHGREVTKKLSEIRRYYCIAYLKNKGKKRSWLSECRIKYQILRVYLDEKHSLKEIFEICPSMRLLFPIAWLIHAIRIK